jgi:transcriptional regulator with XRE-family HTH domain
MGAGALDFSVAMKCPFVVRASGRLGPPRGLLTLSTPLLSHNRLPLSTGFAFSTEINNHYSVNTVDVPRTNCYAVPRFPDQRRCLLESQELAARHIALRDQAGLTQEQEAKMAGVSPTTISGIESGKITRPHLKTLLKIARALGADVGELRDSGKAEAPPSPTQPPLNGFEERRTDWSTAVKEAKRLREIGPLRMDEALDAWRASKERGEGYAARRIYLDAMGMLLQQAYDAVTALVKASSGARLADQWPEIQKADRFYVELWRRIQDAGLSIRTDGEQAAEQEALTEGAQPEPRPYCVEEPEAA